MEQINQIFQHALYQKHFQELQEAEKDRIFCNHTLEHFLDTARLMYIYNIEEQAGLSKKIIYAAAMLHDIGRNAQIRCGIPHEVAGAEIAELIMKDCGFSADEIRMVQNAISQHRQSAKPGTAEADQQRAESTEADQQRAESTEADQKGLESTETDRQRSEPSENQAEILADYLYRADKQSRNCFACKAFGECNWAIDLKNMKIRG